MLRAKRRKAKQDVIDAKEKDGTNCVTEELAWASSEKRYQGLWHSKEHHRPVRPPRDQLRFAAPERDLTPS